MLYLNMKYIIGISITRKMDMHDISTLNIRQFKYKCLKKYVFFTNDS